MANRQQYKKEQIEFCNKQLLGVCIKLTNSKTEEEYKMLCKLEKQYKDLLEYYNNKL